MNRSFSYILILVLTFTGFACTSARWTVKEKSAVDRDDYRILNSEEFLSTASAVTPESPTLKLQVLSETTYEYAEKILVQRTIQDYKIKPGFLVLGIVGAGLAAYAANSNAITGERSSAATISLNTAAALIAGAGFMNMKPVGDPRPTGEERFLRKTGVLIQQDTLQAENTPTQTAHIDIWYGDNKLMSEESRSLRGGELDINLGGLLSSLEIQGRDTKDVRVEVQYRDSTYSYSYLLDEVLQPFAEITAPVAELRSAPEQSQENILAELIEGSQLQIVETIGTEWYKILYGISENYISQEDAELIWRTSDFSQQSEVVAVPVIPFGNVDVENNIPILTGIHANALGLIVTNENYGKPYAARSHTHRDGRLMQVYMENALGLEPQNIYEVKDVRTPDSLFAALQNIRKKANDSTQVLIYLSGYGTISRQGGEDYHLSYQPVAGSSDTLADEPAINLSELFREIASIPSGKMIVLADIEFRSPAGTPDITESELDLAQPLRRLSRLITGNKPDATVIFSSKINQDSELYVADRGEDKKHHLFPYFFAKALQERNTGMGSIFQYLQRNIPYTARRLHDRSQDPQIFGNTSLQLIPSQ